MFARELTFAIITPILAVSLVYSSFSEVLFAAPRDPRWGSGSTCTFDKPGDPSTITCCWREQIPGSVLGEAYCQSCTWDELTGSYSDCDPKEVQMRGLPTGDLPLIEAVPVPSNRTLPGGGDLPSDLPTLEQVPRGTLPLPEGGDLPTLQPGPGFNQGTEGEPPLPVICSEEAGLEKDPETGQCVPIESPVTDEQPEETTEEPEEEQQQPEEEQQQPTEEEGGNDNNDN